MSLQREIEIFDNVRISPETGETDIWDRVIFPNTVRVREIDLILDLVNELKPKRILDFGCGAGWVSKILVSKGYHVVGIDTSSFLVESASHLCSREADFVVGDCMNLPFCDEAFDLVVGMAILHHLEPETGIAECHRVVAKGGALLLMEPNKYNPIAALARKISPVDTQTPDEEPFTPKRIKEALNSQNWTTSNLKYMFLFSFGLSRVLKRTRLDKQWLMFMCPLIRSFERMFESIPLVNRLCWVIATVNRKD